MASPSKKRPLEEEKEDAIKLRCLGFCGADDSIEPALLLAISAQHTWVEWGVLFRPDKAGLPRYASDAWLERLASINIARKMRLAGHLCSTRVDELLEGDTHFVQRMHKDCGFTRFQINATKANGTNMSLFSSDASATRCVSKLREAFAHVPEAEFIMQCNSETQPLVKLLVRACLFQLVRQECAGCLCTKHS